MLPEAVTAPVKNAAAALDATVSSTWSETTLVMAVVGGLLLLSLVFVFISWAVSVRLYTRKAY